MNTADLLKLIKHRRSIRIFTGEKIASKDIDKIIEAGIWAPSGCNNQEIRFLVLTEPKDVVQMVDVKPFFQGVAAFILVFYDLSLPRSKKLYVKRRQNRHVPELDAGLAVQNMMLMAENLNIGTCVFNLTKWHFGQTVSRVNIFQRILRYLRHKYQFQVESLENNLEYILRKKLKVPAQYKIICGLALGKTKFYPDVTKIYHAGDPIMRQGINHYLIDRKNPDQKNKVWYADGQNPAESFQIYQENCVNAYNQDKEMVARKSLARLFSPTEWKTKKVLDVGCGLGIFTKILADLGAKVTGLDALPSALKAAKSYCPKANFVCQDAGKIQLEQKFDLIFAKDIIEHIKNDQLFLKKLSEHLVPGGYLWLNTQNSHSLNYVFQNTIARLKGNKNWLGWDTNHYRFYNAPELTQMLNKYHLQPTQWFGSYFFPYRAMEKWFGLKSQWSFCRLVEKWHLWHIYPFNITGWNIGVIAQKK